MSKFRDEEREKNQNLLISTCFDNMVLSNPSEHACAFRALTLNEIKLLEVEEDLVFEAQGHAAVVCLSILAYIGLSLSLLAMCQ